MSRVQIKETRPLWGKVIRIGGKTPTAQVEVPGHGLVTVDLDSEELARRLAERLYEFVRLEGDLTRDFTTNEITRFKARDFKSFEPFKKSESLARLSKRLGKHFAGIEDVVRYVEELRGGE